jgi:uncharacterized protein (UPF0333 family)
MIFKENAQGTIEYLVIIAVVVVVGLTVTSLVSNSANTSAVGNTTEEIFNSAKTVGISESIINTANDEKLIGIQNNTGKRFEVTKVIVDDVENEVKGTVFSGSKQFVSIPDLSNCEEGQSVTSKVTIEYEDEYGITKTETFDSVTIPCTTASVKEESILDNELEVKFLIEEVRFTAYDNYLSTNDLMEKGLGIVLKNERDFDVNINSIELNDSGIPLYPANIDTVDLQINDTRQIFMQLKPYDTGKSYYYNSSGYYLSDGESDYLSKIFEANEYSGIFIGSGVLLEDYLDNSIGDTITGTIDINYTTEYKTGIYQLEFSTEVEPGNAKNLYSYYTDVGSIEEQPILSYVRIAGAEEEPGEVHNKGAAIQITNNWDQDINIYQIRFGSTTVPVITTTYNGYFKPVFDGNYFTKNYFADILNENYTEGAIYKNYNNASIENPQGLIVTSGDRFSYTPSQTYISGSIYYEYDGELGQSSFGTKYLELSSDRPSNLYSYYGSE